MNFIIETIKALFKNKKSSTDTKHPLIYVIYVCPVCYTVYYKDETMPKYHHELDICPVRLYPKCFVSCIPAGATLDKSTFVRAIGRKEIKPYTANVPPLFPDRSANQINFKYPIEIKENKNESDRLETDK